MRAVERSTNAARRARALVVLVLSVVALGWASLHGPSMALRHAALVAGAAAAADREDGLRQAGGEGRVVTESVGSTALPSVRASSAEDLRAPRLEGTPLALVPANLRVSVASAESSALTSKPPRANHSSPAKTHAELMVFLN